MKLTFGSVLEFLESIWRRKTFYRINSLLWADILVIFAFFVIQNYFTEVWKLSLTHASTILNIWNGMYRILPVFFLYLIDSFLGHFKLLVITSISYSVGLVFVFMSLPPILAESTHTCKAYEPQCIGDTQVGLLYAGLALTAVGLAGNLVSVHKFIDDQRELNDENRDHYLRPDLIVVVIVGAFGKVIPFIRPWTLRFGIPAVFIVLCTLGFITGSHSYKKEPPNPNGSFLCTLCRVFVAAARKRSQPYPGDDNDPRYHGIDQNKFSSSSYLRALHKAAIIEEDGVLLNRWKLCSVAEVEDAKVIVRMVPIWITFVFCGIISSTGDTYFVEQAGKMDRHIGKLKLPLEVFIMAKMLFSHAAKDYGRLILAIFGKRKWLPILWAVVNMGLSVGCFITAGVTEMQRLKVVRRHGLLDKPDEDVPMSAFWLLFQFNILAAIEITPSSMNAYYRDECPKSLEAYLQCFGRAMFGLGFMCSSVCVFLVGRISEIGGGRNWFQETLNQSRLDRYYWVLTVLSSVNYIVFYVVAISYAILGEQGRRELDAGGATADEHVEGENARSII